MGQHDIEGGKLSRNGVRVALNQLPIYGNRTDEQIAQLSELRTKLFGSSGVHDGK